MQQYDSAFNKEANIAQKLKADKRQKLAQDIAQRWKDYTTDISELIDDSREAWDFYLRNHPNPKVMGQSKDANKFDVPVARSKGLRLGQIPKAVDSILSLIHNTLFPIDDRFFRGTPRNELATSLQEPFETFLAENFGEAQTSTKMREFFHNAILDGTACAHVPFRRVEHERVVYEKPVMDIGIAQLSIPWRPVQEQTKTILDWEGTCFEPLDFNDWRVDPTARSMDQSCFLRRWYKTTSEVKEEFPWVKDVAVYLPTDTDGTEKRQSAGLPDLVQSIGSSETEGKKKALLMCCYDDFIIDGKSYRNHVAVVLNDEELVWFGPNTYNHGRIPYIVAPYSPIPGQIYGMSAVKHAIPSAEYIDKATNLFLKNAAWGSIPIIMKNLKDAAVRKHGNVEVQPGMTLPVENFNAYQQLQIDLTNLTYLQAVIERNEQNIQEVTGANPFIAGDQPQTSEVTAFEVDQRVQGGNSRFQSIMTNMSNTVLEPYMQMSFSNFQQFKSVPETVGEFVIQPDDIKLMDFKWVMTAAQATISRNRRMANRKALLFEVMPQLVANGIVKLKPVGLEFDQAAVLREFLIDSGELNADKVLKIIPLQLDQAMAPMDDGTGEMNGGVMNGEYPSVPPTPNTGATGPA